MTRGDDDLGAVDHEGRGKGPEPRPLLAPFSLPGAISLLLCPLNTEQTVLHSIQP